MGTMRTFDPDGWTPRELVSPDGRRFTPSTRAEEGELLARRYRVANPEQDQAVGGEPVAPAPQDLAPASQPVAAPAADEAGQSAAPAAAESVVDDVPPADPAAAPVDAAEPAPPKPRRARAATPSAPTTSEESQA